MKVVAIIQARLGSTRCPKKVIRGIEGKPLLAYVIERVKLAKLVDSIIVAIPLKDHKEISGALEGYIPPKCGFYLHPGDENDVAGRFASALRINPCDAFVRICADSPLIDPELIDDAVKILKLGNPCTDISWSMVYNSHYPHGQQVEAVRTGLFFDRLDNFNKDQREHVTSWFYEVPFVAFCGLESLENNSKVRMVVDTEEDFENMKTLIGKMDRPHTEYHWRELMGMM